MCLPMGKRVWCVSVHYYKYLQKIILLFHSLFDNTLSSKRWIDDEDGEDDEDEDEDEDEEEEEDEDVDDDDFFLIRRVWEWS